MCTYLKACLVGLFLSDLSAYYSKAYFLLPKLLGAGQIPRNQHQRLGRLLLGS